METKHATVRMPESTYTKLQSDAAKHGRSVSEEIRIRVENECACDGRGYIGWHDGSFVYCNCRLGLGYAMDELSKTIQVVAEAAATMPTAKANVRERDAKDRHLKYLNEQHDMLYADWERLAE